MKTADMTRGDLLRKILSFSIPVWLGLLFQQFYNIADTVIVGRLLGVNALAGVGSTTGLTFLALSISSNLGNGFAVSVSQRFGAGDEAGVRKCFENAVLLAVIISAGLTAVTVLITNPVLTVTNTPEEIYSYAHDYVIVIFGGLAATIFYNLFAAVLRATGDSRTPLIGLVIASLINIGLDLLMIGAFHLGVAGAAFATVISQALSAVFLIFCIRKNGGVLRISFHHPRLSARLSAEQLKTALPMTLEGIVISAGIMIVQTAINTMGTLYVAGCTAGNKLYGILAAPVEAVCEAMIPVSGQNYGAGKYDRIDQGLRYVLTAGWVLMAVLFVLAWFFGPAMMGLFLEQAEAEIVSYGHRFMLCYVLGFGFLTIQMSMCYTLQGTGFAGMTIMSGVLETAGRVFGAVVLTRVLGFTGICLALPLAWVFTSAYLIPAWLHCRAKIRHRSA